MASWDTAVKRSLGSCGESVFIGQNVIFTNPREVHLGSRVRIDPNVLITTALKTGNNIQICANAVLGGGSKQTITLGDWAYIGYHSSLFCGSESYSGDFGPVNAYWGSNKVYEGDIEFKDYAGVASNVIVMPGITLPEGTVIGAMSFVYSDKDLLPYSIFLGNPLKYHKPRNKENIIKLSQDPGWLKKHE